MSTLARLQSLTSFDVYGEGEVPATPSRPYFVFYPGSPRPDARPVGGVARREAIRDRVMCVNNNPDGANYMGRLVVGLFEGWRVTEAEQVRTFVPMSQPIADPDMTTGYRWSLNVELNYHAVRSPRA